MNPILFDDFLRAALREDIATGDVTTEGLIPSGRMARGTIKAKEPGVICGLDIAGRAFFLLDAAVCWTPIVSEGVSVAAGDVVVKLSGPAAPILTGERVALNVLARLSGIATATARAVEAVAGTNARVTDTRKTMPLWRTLDKYAVRMGGAINHRMNLSDGVLIKENHISAAGGIEIAVAQARRRAPHTLKIEVETTNLDEVREALRAGADIIMLDNMSVEQMAEAVRLINGRALTEASGNMGVRDLRQVADTGVDLISIGALTHSAKSLDLSLRLE